MSLHQGNIENKILTYNCYKAGLLRQQEKQHVRNARVIWNTCKNLLEKEAFCNDEPRQSRQGGKFCLLECIEIFAKTHWKEKHVCPNL